MNVLKPEKKIAVLSALLEGCSIRATSRMTGCHKTTIMRVLNDIGARCQAELDERLRNVECEAVECDELWSFIWKKEAMLTAQQFSSQVSEHSWGFSERGVSSVGESSGLLIRESQVRALPTP